MSQNYTTEFKRRSFVFIREKHVFTKAPQLNMVYPRLLSLRGKQFREECIAIF